MEEKKIENHAGVKRRYTEYTVRSENESIKKEKAENLKEK